MNRTQVETPTDGQQSWGKPGTKTKLLETIRNNRIADLYPYTPPQVPTTDLDIAAEFAEVAEPGAPFITHNKRFWQDDKEQETEINDEEI